MTKILGPRLRLLSAVLVVLFLFVATPTTPGESCSCDYEKIQVTFYNRFKTPQSYELKVFGIVINTIELPNVVIVIVDLGNPISGSTQKLTMNINEEKTVDLARDSTHHFTVFELRYNYAKIDPEEAKNLSIEELIKRAATPYDVLLAGVIVDNSIVEIKGGNPNWNPNQHY